MQGRLSPLIDNKIQAFPWGYWQDEFSIAKSIGLKKIEWTIDQERLNENPIMFAKGREQISNICRANNVKIIALTGDCFMQCPFWKELDNQRASSLKRNFIEVCEAASCLGIGVIVIPLVDNGAIVNKTQEKSLIEFFLDNIKLFCEFKIKLAFESDYEPNTLRQFIKKFPSNIFGINYDTGNSAHLGYNPIEEWDLLGDRIIHMHIKDRKLNKGTVRLGSGDVNFDKVFRQVVKYQYHGQMVLQTARANDNNHKSELVKNLVFLEGFN